MSVAPRQVLLRSLLLAAVVAVAGCTIAKPRTDDPWQGFNRKAYAFNHAIDRAVIRPVALGYRKVTNPPVREHITDFFSNIQLPVAIANDLLQAKPTRALQTTGRFFINLTIGFFGFFDPASHMGLPDDDNDFGVTLARWGVPSGPFVIVPFLGPNTVRSVWRYPVDGHFFDPLSIFARTHNYGHGQQYLPEVIYLINLRARAIDAESFLESAYDPYVFLRDAWRQRRIYLIYYGNPPASVIERMQGLDQENFDPEQLLEQQRAWEKKHGTNPDKADAVTPAPAASSGTSH